MIAVSYALKQKTLTFIAVLFGALYIAALFTPTAVLADHTEAHCRSQFPPSQQDQLVTCISISQQTEEDCAAIPIDVERQNCIDAARARQAQRDADAAGGDPGGAGGAAQQSVSDLCELPGAASSSFCSNQDEGNGSRTNNVIIGERGILNELIQVLIYITAIVSTFVIIIAGIMFTVSSGDAGTTNRARSAIIYSVVALVVAMFAQILVLFVLDRL